MCVCVCVCVFVCVRVHTHVWHCRDLDFIRVAHVFQYSIAYHIELLIISAQTQLSCIQQGGTS